MTYREVPIEKQEISIKENPQHQTISVSRYANSKEKRCAIEELDISIY